MRNRDFLTRRREAFRVRPLTLNGAFFRDDLEILLPTWDRTAHL